MKYISNCHTHTNYCDGKSPAEDTVKAAIELGFVSLGFSGHAPLPYETGWAMSVEKTATYLKEIKALKEKYRGTLDIVCGIEYDVDTLDMIDLDDYEYVIGSVHELHNGEEHSPVDHSAEYLKNGCEKLFGGDYNCLAKYYYSQVYEVCKIPQVNIVGHYDLITKFNTVSRLFDETDKEYQSIALEVLDGIIDLRPGLMFEVNTGAMNRAKKSGAYPADFLLNRMHERNVPITLTSDCHSADTLTFGFDTGAEQCRNAGYKSVYILTSDGFKETSL